MAYTVNGKVYTEHPLMDEMIYNLDIIMKNIEIKNEDLALKYETEETINAADNYISIYEGTMTFDLFPFTEELLVEYGYSKSDAKRYVGNRYWIPEEDRDDVMKVCGQLYLDEYVEYNNYYRELLGLPWLKEGVEPEKYYVYIDSSMITDPYVQDIFDYDIPLHEYTSYQIAILQTLGIMDQIYNDEKHQGKEYHYLHFLGDQRRDEYDIRIAAKWDILYMPSVETLVSDRFKQLFQINREVMLHRYYSDAYKVQSDYYDEFMIILLLCQTYTDMIAEIPEWYVRRDVFDLRSCQYFMEANGVEFFKIIPLKYQIRIVKNLNKLIRYKSTNKNIWDIIEIFDVDATVYKYYIFKKRIANENGSYATGKDPADEYELEFIKTAIGDTYDNFIKNNIYREPYDEITYQDKWWDGQDTHQLVKDNHLAKDFTIEGTKYMSLEVEISLSEYSYQIQYFLGLLLDSSMELDNLKVSIPSISSLVSFSLTDLFILLYCLTAAYDDYQLITRVPEDNTYLDKPEFEPYWQDNYGCNPECLRPMSSGYEAPYIYISQEYFYNWLSWKYPYLWTNMSCRMYGFNMNADLDELAELVGMRHSHFHFERGYTLEDLGVDGFITQTKVDSIDELVYIYENNTEIYNHVYDLIVNAETRDERVVYQFVFDYLFTRDFDYQKYTLQNTGELSNTYDEVLRERNYILYNYYKTLTSESDLETRQDNIRQGMNDIINTLEYYLNYDCLEYIFSVFTVTSFSSMIKYIYLLINFFKSFKVYFLDPYITYVADNKLDNTVEMDDSMGGMKDVYWKFDKDQHHDVVNMSTELEFEDRYTEDNMVEIMDLYGYYEPDPLMDLDARGNFVAEGWVMWDLDGGPAEPQKWSLNIDGKHPEESEQQYWYNIVSGFYDDDLTGEIPEYDYDPSDSWHGPIRDVDAGGPGLLQSCPYVQFNGGWVGAGLYLEDLDGGSPMDHEFYVNIDGTTPDPEISKGWGDVLYYDLRGGHPDWNMMMSNTLVVRIVDSQISMDVRLVETYRNKDSVIETVDGDDGGLYIEDKWVSIQDAEDYKNYLGSLTDMYMDFYNSSCEEIEIAKGNDELLESRIETIIQRYLGDAIKTGERVTGGQLDIDKEYTNMKASEYEDLVNQWILLYRGWGEF